MHPTILGMRAYPVAIGAAVTVAAALSCRELRRRGVPVWQGILFQALLVALGLTGARLYAAYEFGTLATWTSGTALRYPGGLLLAAAGALAARRVARVRLSAAAIGDAFVPGMAFALIGIRLGCLLHGCCYGLRSDLPWAMSYPPGTPAWLDQLHAGIVGPDALRSEPVHPLHLYLGLCALGAWVVARGAASLGEGASFLLFLAVHDAGKAGLEVLRAPAPVWHLQVGSLAAASAAVVVLWASCRRGGLRLWRPRPVVR